MSRPYPRPTPLRVIAAAAVPAALIGAETLVTKHPYVEAAGAFGFYAAFGFGAAVALVLVAWALRLAFGRPEGFHDD